MTSVRDFTKRVFGTSKIMTAVAIAMIIVGVVMGGLFVAGWADKQQKEDLAEQRMTPGATTPTLNQGQAPTVANQKTYTTAEVAQHNSVEDCWMIIGSGVYNLTSFLRQHPGGVQSMSPYCGKDGTKAFETMDKGRGQTHSQSASMLKEDYKIGTLAN